MAKAAQMPMGAYSRSCLMPMRVMAVRATMVPQMTNFQKFSHWETWSEKTGALSVVAAGRGFLVSGGAIEEFAAMLALLGDGEDDFAAERAAFGGFGIGGDGGCGGGLGLGRGGDGVFADDRLERAFAGRAIDRARELLIRYEETVSAETGDLIIHDRGYCREVVGIWKRNLARGGSAP